MDYTQEKSLSRELSKLKNIDELEQLIEEKKRLLSIKERELELRKELIFARIESNYGISDEGFNSGTFVSGVLKDVFRNKPEIEGSMLMKGVRGLTQFLPFILKAVRR